MRRPFPLANPPKPAPPCCLRPKPPSAPVRPGPVRPSPIRRPSR